MSNKNINEDLLAAIRKNNLSQALKLINEGADINYKDKLGHNSLWYAVCANSFNITKLVIENGTNINEQFEKQKSVLDVAVEYHGRHYYSIDIIKLLIENGANLNIKDKYGNTPLFYACISYDVNVDVIELLIEKGADINIKNKHGMSPYMMAVENEMVELKNLLDSLSRAHSPAPGRV